MAKIPAGFRNVRPNEGGGHYVYEANERFHIGRHSSNKWLVKVDPDPNLPKWKFSGKVIGEVSTLADVEPLIDYFLEEEEAVNELKKVRQSRIQKLANEVRGIYIMGAISTNDPEWEGEDAGDHIEHMFGNHSQTIGFTLSDLERMFQHIKGDQYRGPG